MVKKLAVVISGAVSLGSYEAGVTYEVLEAIAKHNESMPDDRIEIDVITGASAGGMTATILAKSLLYHGPTLRDPYKNPLYKAWVEEVSMIGSTDKPGLLQVNKNLHKYSILNIAILDRIAKRVLPDNPGLCTEDCPKGEAHPAASKDISNSPSLILGLAMGNLNGFPLGVKLNHLRPSPDEDSPADDKVTQADEFIYSQYKDRFVARISRPNHASPSEPAVPLALEEWEEYDDPELKNRWRRRECNMDEEQVNWAQLREIALSSGAFPFAFSPRMITRRSDQQVEAKALHKKRDSDSKKAAFQKGGATDPFDGKYIYTDGGVFENEPVGLAISLIDSLYDPNSQWSGMGADRYFLFIAPGARKANSDPFRTTKKEVDEDGDRLPPDHLAVAKSLVSAIMGQSRFQDWIKHSKPPKVLAITSKDEELLGDVFSAFSGFLEEKFRAYDYNIGRQSAQDKLDSLSKDKTLPFKWELGSDQQPQWPPPTDSLKDKKNRWVWSYVNDGTKDETNKELKEKVFPETWQDAREKFGKLAEIRTNTNGQRDQLEELKRLLDNVDLDKRKQIRDQILSRTKSLVGFLYERVNEDESSKSFWSRLAGGLVAIKGLWAIARGGAAIEEFTSELASYWLKKNLNL